jgi:DNA-binding NarL/FixJ family response regulator
VIRVVLVDDQEVVRAGLRVLAEHEGDIAVVDEAADGRAGLAAVRRHRPDVVLMDIRMPVVDGLDATAAIVADPALAGVRVVVLTTFDDDEDIRRAVRAGAAGYLLKDIAPADLRRAQPTCAGRCAPWPPATPCSTRRSPGGSWPSWPVTCSAPRGPRFSTGSPAGSATCCTGSGSASRTPRSARACT